MYDSYGYSVSLFDGICMETKELDTLTGFMPNNDKWTISSSGHHMFVSFSKGLYFGLVDPKPGFLANIHYGKKLNDLKIVHT